MTKSKASNAKSSSKSDKERRTQAPSKVRKLQNEDLKKVTGGRQGQWGPGWIEC